MATKSYTVKRFSEAIRDVLTGLRVVFVNLVLSFFESVNEQIHSRVHVWRMEQETSDHVNMLIKVFEFVVLPGSLFYVCSNYLIFKENALDSMLLGILIFVYSNFLPDLPSVYEKRKNNKKTEDLPWYKKYSLLLFAPVFICALFGGTRLGWETTETFHNFKSLTVYGGFLLLLGCAFTSLPISIADISRIIPIPLCGLVGYLTHLKVDEIW